MILISISFCALVSIFIRLAAFGFDPVECRPPRSPSGSLWLRLSLPVSRARTLASVLVPHIVARFFSTGFRRWTALELRALYMSSINLGGFRWPVISVFHLPLARSGPAVHVLTLGLRPVERSAVAVRPGVARRSSALASLCFSCSHVLHGIVVFACRCSGHRSFSVCFRGVFRSTRFKVCVCVCVCVCV